MKKLLYAIIFGLVPAVHCGISVVQNNLTIPVYSDFYNNEGCTFHYTTKEIPVGAVPIPASKTVQIPELCSYHAVRFRAFYGLKSLWLTLSKNSPFQTLGFIIDQEGDNVVVSVHNLKNNQIDTSTKLFDKKILKKDFYGK